jgi:phage shock protein E
MTPPPEKEVVIMGSVIVDVREAEEYAESHVEGSINIPLGKLIREPDGVLNVPKETEIILYCRRVINGINQEQVETRPM